MLAYIKEIIPINVEWSEHMCLAVYFSGSNFNAGWLADKNLNTINNEIFAKDIKEIKREIETQAVGMDTVILTGGEPCLQRLALLSIAKIIKEKNLKCGLETNGTKPDIIKALFEEKLIDFLIINLNSTFVPELFEKITKSRSFFITSETIIHDIKKTLEITKSANIPLEIRTTIIPTLLYKKEDVLEIAKELKDIDCIWKLKKFTNAEKLMDKRFQALNPPSDQFLEDLREVCLRNYPQLRIEIMQELQQPIV
ncbi:radical SAM protein [Candidatus Woesearchaeota archaeon]|nr:radical SAM protein [Candidatus Woesearchaeota archaeon]